MNLTHSGRHRALQAEILEFARTQGHLSPKPGGRRKHPDQKTLDWQRLLLERGYVARTIPREYGSYGAAQRDEARPAARHDRRRVQGPQRARLSHGGEASALRALAHVERGRGGGAFAAIDRPRPLRFPTLGARGTHGAETASGREARG
jgi:alkylation response protein AidB-like acyl-CoA dehydrogenase